MEIIAYYYPAFNTEWLNMTVYMTFISFSSMSRPLKLSVFMLSVQKSVCIHHISPFHASCCTNCTILAPPAVYVALINYSALQIDQDTKYFWKLNSGKILLKNM
jgi:hypothetical protein